MTAPSGEIPLAAIEVAFAELDGALPRILHSDAGQQAYWKIVTGRMLRAALPLLQEREITGNNERFEKAPKPTAHELELSSILGRLAEPLTDREAQEAGEVFVLHQGFGNPYALTSAIEMILRGRVRAPFPSQTEESK